jgi:hypothetical protein
MRGVRNGFGKGRCPLYCVADMSGNSEGERRICVGEEVDGFKSRHGLEESHKLLWCVRREEYWAVLTENAIKNVAVIKFQEV